MKVYLTVLVPMSTYIEVDEKDEDKAVRKAIRLVLTDPEFNVTDFDGNNVALSAGDIKLDSVEE